MKDAYEVLQQKEKELACVRREVDSLRIVSSLLSDTAESNEHSHKPPAREDGTTTDGENTQATGTDGLFASANGSRSKFWNILNKEK